ncbi:hypothetical protein BGZ70_003022 [Mortierella alpina]|uniref:Copper transport protein n=1 Tax=Mortierella alpina TaxID=64518 RepID=A0A9P6IUW3_MORAP|nr:hypothetical protein BGZ70_003022 [Mortierella alpina]
MTAGFAPGLGTPVWSPNLTPSSESEYIGALLGLFVLSVGFRGLVAAQGYLEAYLHLHSYPRPPSRPRTKHAPFPSTPPFHSHHPDHASPAPPLDSAHTKQDVDANHHHHHQQQLSTIEPAAALEYIDEKHILSNDNTASSLSPAHYPQGSLLQVPPSGQGAQQRRRYASTTTTTMNSPNRPLHPDDDDFSPASGWSFPLPTAQPFVWQAEISRALLATVVVAVGYMLMLVIMTYNSAYLAVILVGVFVGEVYFARWGRVRPIFPAAPLRRGGRCDKGAADSHRQGPVPPHPQEQPQHPQHPHEQAVSTTIPSAFSSNIHDDSIRRHQQQQGEPWTRTSASSARSSTSSGGYSSTMMNHGLSADGAC